MTFFLAGVALLLILVLGVRLLHKADPKKLASILRKVTGVVALAAALFLTVRGAFPLAIPLGVFGLALLGRPAGSGFGFGLGGARKSPGQTSKVRTEALEMELDHDTGRMDGRCLTGTFEGRPLSTLSDTEVLELFEELERSDVHGAALLEAYLDWRLPDWCDGRERAGDGPSDGPSGGPSESAGEQRRRRAASSRMSPEEAYAVLGLSEGASPNDIRRAHRSLMKKLHPDQGGSNYLATRINEAKEVLLGST
jgi:hypothetical protein